MSASKDLPTSPKAGGSIDKDIDVQSGKLGTGPGYSGQEYDSHAHASERALDANTSHGVTPPTDDATLPPDNGKRASYDPTTGAVRGSGAGAVAATRARISTATRRPATASRRPAATSISNADRAPRQRALIALTSDLDAAGSAVRERSDDEEHNPGDGRRACGSDPDFGRAGAQPGQRQRPLRLG